MIDFNKLPQDLQQTLLDYKKAQDTNNSLLDCYLTEVITAINGYVRIGQITKSEAEYIKENYL